MFSCDSHSTLLLYPINETAFDKFLLIASGLLKTQHNLIFLITSQRLLPRLEELRQRNISYKVLGVDEVVAVITQLNKESQKIINISPCSRGGPLLGFLLKNIFSLKIKKCIYEYRRKRQFGQVLLSKYLEVKKFIEKENPIAIVVSGDRHQQYEPALLRVARENNISIWIPPISVYDNPKDLARFKLTRNEDLDVTKTMFFRRKWPLQCMSDGHGHIVSFYPPWQVEILDRLNMLNPNPWVMGSGNKSRIMVTGEEAKLRLESYGLDQRKIEVTGDPEFDYLFDGKKTREKSRSLLTEKYSLNPSKRIIMVALPQLYEHKILNYQDHCQTIAHICTVLSDSNCNVLASLHPKMNIANYRHVERQYKIKILEEPLREVLPSADLFVTGQGSSTKLWAILLLIPTLVLDWYGLDYETHGFDAGVIEIKKKQHFETKLQEVLSSRKVWKTLVEKQKFIANAVGLLDGNALERVVSHLMASSRT